MIPEEAIRLRSYLIWQKVGCPEGQALEHWLCARRELEAEYVASLLRLDDCERTVMPRLPILRRPQRMTSARIPSGGRRAPAIVATQ